MATARKFGPIGENLRKRNKWFRSFPLHFLIRFISMLFGVIAKICGRADDCQHALKAQALSAL